MIRQIIKKHLVKALKKRVLKCTQRLGNHDDVISFITNAPLKEWRSRLWFVENIRETDGSCCTDEKLFQWLNRS